MGFFIEISVSRRGAVGLARTVWIGEVFGCESVAPGTILQYLP
jgi:hypothetical protein